MLWADHGPYFSTIRRFRSSISAAFKGFFDLSPSAIRHSPSNLAPGESLFLRRHADPVDGTAERAGQRRASERRRVVLLREMGSDDVLQAAAIHGPHDFRRGRIGEMPQPPPDALLEPLRIRPADQHAR